MPPNGLAMFCGLVSDSSGKERKILIDFEPFAPTTKAIYKCDKKFHTETLDVDLEDKEKIGFIVIDGNGCLFGLLQGDRRETLQKISVSLPSKQGRGGQSKNRFERLRQEKRHNYLKKVCEMAVANFITNDLCNVDGLIVAGASFFKDEFLKANFLDKRLKEKVLASVDVAYGGQAGFNQAIDLASSHLQSFNIGKERKVLGNLFEEIEKESQLVAYGLDETCINLENGTLKTLIIWDGLEAFRYTLRCTSATKQPVEPIVIYAKDQTDFEKRRS